MPDRRSGWVVNTLAIAVLWLAFLVTGAPVASAEVGASAWADVPQGRVRLISALNGVADETRLLVGVEFDQKSPWKIYWRNAGDAGYPPTFDWTGSKGILDTEVKWPVPGRFSTAGIETIGYPGRIVLPILTTLDKDHDGPVELRVHVDYLTCDDRLCVPQAVNLALDVPAGAWAATAFLPPLSETLSNVPKENISQGLEVEEAVIEPDGVMRVVVRSNLPMTAIDLFADGPSGMAFEPPVILRTDDGLQATVWSKRYGGVSLEGVDLNALFTADQRGVEVPIDTSVLAAALPRPSVGYQAVPDADKSAPLTAPRPTLVTVALIALLGGLILNLMPCVLPVLSLKVLGVLKSSGSGPGKARVSFLATSLGIIFSFLALAALTIALKSVGASVGWGIHFQHPAFLSLMAVVLVLFAANLWGWFEIPMPGFLGGSRVPSGEGTFAGAFGTGMFATLMATPCSAPFVGTAVGFALSAGALETVLVFFCMGVGMAVPYLIGLVFPGLVRLLPRPGSWMLALKAILGVLLVATAAWLLVVFRAQTSLSTMVVLAALLVLLIAVLGTRSGIRSETLTARFLTIVTIALVIMAACLPVLASYTWLRGQTGTTTEATDRVSQWRDFSPEKLNKLIENGDTVLVDVTADWCVTCRVNKAVVLDRGAVRTAIETSRVRALRADWTRPNDDIARYLASFGRYGIPFNVVYGPGAPEGLPLPEILTEKAVMDAIEQAEGKR